MTTITWEGSDFFAGIALLLEINPDMVMAAYNAPGAVTVLYTREADRASDDPPVWMALLSGYGSDLKVERCADTGRTFSSFMPS